MATIIIINQIMEQLCPRAGFNGLWNSFMRDTDVDVQRDLYESLWEPLSENGAPFRDFISGALADVDFMEKDL